MAAPAVAARKRRQVARALLHWWAANRREFPWRSWTDLYRLLVSEVLLRQTRAETVAAFLPAFLDAYPEPADLSRGGEEELAAILRPLGFSRQRAAQLRELAARLDGGPEVLTHGELLTLPGIGRYSAGMVAAATGGQAAAVDTNVARVLCRVFNVTPSHAEARKSTNVWAEAEALVASGTEPAHLTWAILDLAAAVCVLRRPHCSECPLQAWCTYSATATRQGISMTR